MKIILSKKGFDKTYGGYPSVINGKALQSMPIPYNGDPYKYAQLKTESGANLFEAVKPYYKNIYENGEKKLFNADVTCHPDPNLSNYFMADNFLRSVGQVGKPQSHLEKQGVSVGDMFIFYGLFNEVKDGKFVKGQAKHVMFGYLQIGEIIYPQKLSIFERKSYEIKYPWLKQQPHWNFNGKYKADSNSCIYIAAENNFGTFTYSPALDLTKPNAKSQREWLVPALASLELSWNKSNTVAENGSFIIAPTYGQEFVINANAKAIKWTESLIKKHTKKFSNSL